MLAADEAFEGRALERVAIEVELAGFCRRHDSRLPHQFHADPVPPAADYVRRLAAARSRARPGSRELVGERLRRARQPAP